MFGIRFYKWVPINLDTDPSATCLNLGSDHCTVNTEAVQSPVNDTNVRDPPTNASSRVYLQKHAKLYHGILASVGPGFEFSSKTSPMVLSRAIESCAPSAMMFSYP